MTIRRQSLKSIAVINIQDWFLCINDALNFLQAAESRDPFHVNSVTRDFQTVLLSMLLALDYSIAGRCLGTAQLTVLIARKFAIFAADVAGIDADESLMEM